MQCTSPTDPFSGISLRRCFGNRIMNFKYITTIVLLLMILALSRGFVVHYQDFFSLGVLTAYADDGGGGGGGDGGDGGGGDGGGDGGEGDGGGDGGGGDGAAPANTEPTGNFDSADCNFTSGWAYDSDTPGTSVTVHLYKDGPYGIGTIVGGFTADYPRPDVNTFLGVPGNYGFFFSTPDAVKDDFSHDLYVYAIDTSGGTNPLLGGSPITIPACNGTPPPPPPTCVLTADPTTIQAGGSSTISWSQENATDFAIDQGIGNIFFWNVAPIPSGSFPVSPAVTTTYTGTVHDHSGFSPRRTGECSATVTVTDTPQPPLPATIRVNKVVVNDNGGTKVIADFPLFVNTTAVTSGVVNTFSSGTYTVSETNQPGYTATISGDCSASGSVTLAAGENKVCTITNNDNPVPPNPATIRVNKVVVNDNGGTKVIADFPLFVNTTAVTSGVVNTFSPGTYTVSETNQPGYTATISGDCSASGSVTLAAGENKVCTITNNDNPIPPNPATIRVNKVVVNDNGGTKVIADFPLFVNTTAVTSGVVNTFSPGTYTVSETNQPGYTATISGNCSASGSVTLAAGENKVCTITNNDVPPVITTGCTSNCGGGGGGGGPSN